MPCDGLDCNWSALLQLAQNLLNLMIQLAVIIAAGMFAYAGWLYFSAGGDSSRISQAHKIFFAVVVGIVLTLVAWLVVNVILETLTGEGLDERVNEVSLKSVDIQPPIG